MLSVSEFQQASGPLLDLLTRLVEIESPSTDKAAVDRLGQFLSGELEGLGARVTVEERRKVGNLVVGQWHAEMPGGILVMCHMDTVYDLGTLGKQPIRLEDGKLFGPGALDMKAGIALFFQAMRLLQLHGQIPQQPITLLLTSDEEIGSFHSRAVIEKLAVQASLVLCLEPALTDGALKTARKGTGDIEIVTRGRAAHAGANHEQGRNAIEELAHQILAVQRLTDYARGTTTNVGRVSGGTRINVVPEEARAKVDFRVAMPEETERIQRWAAETRPVLEGTQVSIKVTPDRPPMPRDARMVETFLKAQAIAARLGMSLGEGSTGGGSDANLVAPLGVAVLDGLGGWGRGLIQSENL
jgi:glutamate carboxypeptidase